MVDLLEDGEIENLRDFHGFCWDLGWFQGEI